MDKRKIINKKVFIGSTVFLFCISIATFIPAIIRSDFGAAYLFLIFFAEIAGNLSMALAVSLVIDEIILTTQEKYEILYTDDLGNFFYNAIVVVLLICYSMKLLLISSGNIESTLILTMCLQSSNCILISKSNRVYISDNKLYMGKYNKEIHLSEIMRIVRIDSGMAEIIVSDNKYTIGASEQILQKIESKIKQGIAIEIKG
ncbi:MAG: hypothetical protein K0R15_1839 [Clostridiales bacterium]|jgi:hypothetical protein|nr:hypothetical protein [Clostridiales bacterium]